MICTSKITDDSYGIFCRKLTVKFVIEYLEHLKVFNYCTVLSNIFIESVRENGILYSKVKGYWQIKKHSNHEIIIIEHVSNFIEIGEKEEKKVIPKEEFLEDE